MALCIRFGQNLWVDARVQKSVGGKIEFICFSWTTAEGSAVHHPLYSYSCHWIDYERRRCAQADSPSTGPRNRVMDELVKARGSAIDINWLEILVTIAGICRYYLSLELLVVWRVLECSKHRHTAKRYFPRLVYCKVRSVIFCDDS